MNFWVMNIFKGEIRADGPYRQKDSAERRADKIEGGETHVFASLSSDPEVAIQEFRDNMVRRL